MPSTRNGQLAEPGFRLNVKHKNKEATSELREGGAKAIDVVTDVTQEESCLALVAAAVEAFGRLDISSTMPE